MIEWVDAGHSEPSFSYVSVGKRELNTNVLILPGMGHFDRDGTLYLHTQTGPVIAYAGILGFVGVLARSGTYVCFTFSRPCGFVCTCLYVKV